MPQYTASGAAVLLGASSASGLAARVEMSLIKFAATQFATASGNVAAYIRRLAVNPAGEGNAVLPILLATITVAAPGTDTTPLPPTDAELTTGIAGVWSFLCGP